MKIAVLYGGWAPEREVSIKSGENISRVLKNLGYEVAEIDVKKDLKDLTDQLYRINPDFVFNILHGIGGEDGVIQGVLEMFGKPYSTSDVLSSAISFDKAICKTIVKAKGVRVIEGQEISSTDIVNINVSEQLNFDYPFVIKPSANGSSVGVFIIHNEADLNDLKKQNWTFGQKVIIEKYIQGREFTVLVLNGKAIGAVEITYKNEFYDYASKYDIGGSSHIADYELDEATSSEMLKMSEDAFIACGCRGIARVDFRYDNEKVYFLELNTQPGMTDVSLTPDIARFNGISIEDLLQEIIESSISNSNSE